jgi:hypothetical protein
VRSAVGRLPLDSRANGVSWGPRWPIPHAAIKSGNHVVAIERIWLMVDGWCPTAARWLQLQDLLQTLQDLLQHAAENLCQLPETRPEKTPGKNRVKQLVTRNPLGLSGMKIWKPPNYPTRKGREILSHVINRYLPKFIWQWKVTPGTHPSTQTTRVDIPDPWSVVRLRLDVYLGTTKKEEDRSKEHSVITDRKEPFSRE